jgi:hypothetical protein
MASFATSTPTIQTLCPLYFLLPPDFGGHMGRIPAMPLMA